MIPCCYSPGGRGGCSPYLGCERACPRCSPRLPNRGQATLLAIGGTAFQAFLHSWRFSMNSYERLWNHNAEGTATRKSLQATVLLFSDLELPSAPRTQTLTSILCKSTLEFTDSSKLVVLQVSSFRNCCCPCPPEDVGRTFSTVLLMGAKHWKQLRCPPTGKQINNL